MNNDNWDAQDQHENSVLHDTDQSLSFKTQPQYLDSIGFKTKSKMLQKYFRMCPI